MHANISPKLLRAFLALHDCRHFTRAAERSNLSQSAFSMLIQKLEAAVGAQLVERDTRNVALTPEGDLFVEVAQALVSEFDTAFANLNDYIARRKGRVAIAALPSLAANGLPEVIAAYKRRHPGIAVHLVDALSDRCLALLSAGTVDLALTAPVDKLSEFMTVPLCDDPFYLVCRNDHPLAQHAQIAPADLAGCELIYLAKAASVRQHVDLLTEGVAVRPSGFEVEHLATVAGLVAHGLGVALLPALALFQFRGLELATVPLSGQAARPVLIARHRDRPLSVAAKGMLELIQHHWAPHISVEV